MDLWADQREARRDAQAPLAVRMRPARLDEFAGQQHILGPGQLLRRMLDAERLTSVLFWGPPGTGKTTLARLIAEHSGAHFVPANAALVGVKDVRAVLDASRHRIESGGTRTVFFLDEIHRFSRSQQDVLLHDVERGLITLIGATTENPGFTVNSALVSRSTVFRFEPLNEADISTLLRRAITDPRGFGDRTLDVSDEAIEVWAVRSDGDGRRALTALEVAVLSQPDGRIGRAEAEQSMQAKLAVYDRSGDTHYDVASAFIKSMRASDEAAAMYWLARMLDAGEDPRFIARRIAIFASEDIGPADPAALTLAASAWTIIDRIGLPEGRYTLAQAVQHMARAPKSRAATDAIAAADDDVRSGRTRAVPEAQRDRGGMAARGK